VNETVISELMRGLIGVPDTPFIRSLFPRGTELPADHVSLYSGAFGFYRQEAQPKQMIVSAMLRDAVADTVSNVNCASDEGCPGDWVCSRAGKCQHSVLYLHPAHSGRYEWDPDAERWGIANRSAEWPKAVETVWLAPEMRLITLPSYWTGRMSVGIGITLWVVSAALFASFWTANLAHLKTN
jgi:hypothetical protein